LRPLGVSRYSRTARPVSETAKDTLAWSRTLPPDRRGKLLAGISLEKEKELLAAWHAEEGGKITESKG